MSIVTRLLRGVLGVGTGHDHGVSDAWLEDQRRVEVRTGWENAPRWKSPREIAALHREQAWRDRLQARRSA
jgi:hypothetical protein